MTVRWLYIFALGFVIAMANPIAAQERDVLPQFLTQQFPRAPSPPIWFVANGEPIAPQIPAPAPSFGAPEQVFGQPMPLEDSRPNPSAFDPSGLYELNPLESIPPTRRTPVARLHLFAAQIIGDHFNYYTWQNFKMLSVAFGGGAILANTSLDQDFRNSWQANIGRSEAIHSFKYFGEGWIMVPSYGAAMLMGAMFDERPAGDWIGQWGQRSFRATAVGFPPMLLMQWITGGSRPGERTYNSAWHPFKDVNGVSGHSFMGAIPFLTAAQLTDSMMMKMAMVAGSFQHSGIRSLEFT